MCKSGKLRDGVWEALIKRKLHRMVLEVGLRRGSVIVVRDYRFNVVPRNDGDGEVAYVVNLVG